jgi:hypothetical protein
VRYTPIPMFFFDTGCPDWVGCKVTEDGLLDGKASYARAAAVDKNWALDYQTRLDGAAEEAGRKLMDFMYPIKGVRSLCELL